MMVRAFRVLIDCDLCLGEMEKRSCPKCKGTGLIEGTVSWDDFAKLITQVHTSAVKEARTDYVLKMLDGFPGIKPR